MTSEIATKIADRIEAITNNEDWPYSAHREQQCEEIGAMFRDGKFDDLIAPSGRPVLSDETIDSLVNDHCQRIERGCTTSSAYHHILTHEQQWGAAAKVDAARRVFDEVCAWEAYAEQRKAGR